MRRFDDGDAPARGRIGHHALLALTKWSDALNPPVPEGPFASVDEQKKRAEEPEDQD
ncbi:hypothetical protein [Umezawaea beigongshangensis]|uniref:hypothetical protein n=1 Tax=Umezawaea beigongshangensis TaxID=2780383 RepID=UPI0018F11F20|nr:hypothetical protein [Umezawaea beigongshangensis]